MKSRGKPGLAIKVALFLMEALHLVPTHSMSELLHKDHLQNCFGIITMYVEENAHNQSSPHIKRRNTCHFPRIRSKIEEHPCRQDKPRAPTTSKDDSKTGAGQRSPRVALASTGFPRSDMFKFILARLEGSEKRRPQNRACFCRTRHGRMSEIGVRDRRCRGRGCRSRTIHRRMTSCTSYLEGYSRMPTCSSVSS